MSQILHLFLKEDSLARVQLDPGLSVMLQNFSEPLHMLTFCLCSYCNVIQVRIQGVLNEVYSLDSASIRIVQYAVDASRVLKNRFPDILSKVS